MDNSTGDILNEGYLYKQSRYRGSMRKRWMVLKGTCLYSYKPSKGKGIYENPTETFDLQEFKDIKHNKNAKGAKFELIFTNHNRVFVATNISDMNQWITCIKKITTTPETPTPNCDDSKNYVVTIEDMDSRIAQYYAKHGIDNKIGNFSTWCDDNDIDEEMVNEELTADDYDCTVVDFADDFPLTKNIKNEEEKQKAIFIVLKRLYDQTETLNIDELISMNNIEIRMLETFKKFTTIISDGAMLDSIHDKNILFLMSISDNNRNNVLTNIIDSYRRDSVNGQINIRNWITNSQFLKQLNSKLKLKHIDTNMIENDTKNDINRVFQLDLASVIETYPRRIAPVFIPNEHKKYLINDNIESIAKWVGTSCMFVQWLLKIDQDMYDRDYKRDYAAAPFVFDLTFLLNPPSGRNNKLKYFSMQNIMTYLDEKGCISHSVKLPGDLSRTKPLAQTLYAPFEEKMYKQKKCVKYPQYHRFNVIVDRRKMDYKNNVQTVIFDSPNNCNVIPHQFVPENMFELSAKCMVPGSETLTSRSIANGQVLSFSYHVYAENQVKCYMYWMGQCHRFYPYDIVNILPKMFDRRNRGNFDRKIQEFVEIENYGHFNMKRMKCLKDNSFETFYRVIHALRKREFPKPIKNL